MTYALAPSMPGPALLTPEEEERLRQMQATLAAPQPTPTPPPGAALAAMAAPAPASAPAPAPVGAALQTVAPAEPTPRVSLASYLAAGGTNLRNIYNQVSQEERSFIDGMRAAANENGQIATDPASMLKAFKEHMDQFERQPQKIALPDGRSVMMVNNQIIPDPKASPAEIQQDDQNRYIAIDRATGTARVVTDAESGSPVMAKPRLSADQTMMASMHQNAIGRNNAQFQQLQGLDPEVKVSWDPETMTYNRAGWGGTTVKQETERLIKATAAEEQKLQNILNPTGAPAANTAPKSTPSAYASPDEVRAAVRAGKIDRAAALEILRTQFQYK